MEKKRKLSGKTVLKIIGENEPLILCLRNSVFGIRMADIHLPEED